MQKGLNSLNPFLRISSASSPDFSSDLLNTDVIGLGEVAHGSPQLQALAAKTILKFVSLGLRPVTIMLEAPNSSLNVVSSKIARGEQVVTQDLAEIYQVWRTKEMVATFNSFAKINELTPGKVKVVGFDIRQPIDELRQISAAYPDRDLLKKFINVEFIKTLEHAALSLESKSSVHSELIPLREWIETLHVQNVDETTRRALQVVKMWLSTYLQDDIAPLFQERDRSMLSLVLENTVPQRQTIIWAHLAHLLYDSPNLDPTIELLSEVEVLGTLLRIKIQSRFKVIGVTAREFDCMNAKNELRTFNTLPESLETQIPRDSFVQILHEKNPMEVPLCIVKTNGTSLEKEMCPELRFKSLQFDYLIVGE